jgi:colanic acid/amylovoran biosynthesis glycosyltransferase
MTIAYLMNTYPITSTTFIRRELHALERRGLAVKRFAIRRWSEPLVDERDTAEIARTEYLLQDNGARLVMSFLRDLVTRPARVARAIGPWLSLVRSAGGGWIRHVAYLLQACYLVRRAQAAGVSHLHVHFGTNATAVAMLARRMGGPSYSFTVHGPDELVDPVALSFPLKIRDAAWVVAISEYCRSRLKALSEPRDHDKIHVVHCGVEFADLERFRRPQPANRQIVCLGRLCPQKGQVHIPEAVAALKHEFPDLQVLLVGDGESRAAVEAEIARHGVGEQVRILGWMANDKACALVAASRGLLLPSYAEGLPVVLMEAMALERPVVTTTVAGIPELVQPGENGWLVAPGDVPALARALGELLRCTPEQLAAMGRAARRRALEQHDILTEAGKLQRRFAEAR